jgi:hypothetical protein
MDNKAFRWIARGTAVLASAASLAALTPSLAANPEQPSPPPAHYSGLINDYTPSAAVVKGGPYEMRGKWSLDLYARGNVRFSAALNMETSDFGISQGTVDKDDPATRGAHTHHITMTDGVVTSSDWLASCPTFSPAATEGFVVSGTAFVTGNGSPAPFGNPSPLTLCILGGANVKFSNITLRFGAPASKHFGIQAIHGVIVRCAGPEEHTSKDCTVEE